MENTIPSPASRPRTVVVAGLLVLTLAVAGLVYYKWAGSYGRLQAVRAEGWTVSPDGLTAGGALKGTLYYFGKVWIALAFGIVIGAAVRALVSPSLVAGLLSRGGAARRQLAGGLAGAPLMLCSCCVTPIFSSVYQRGARLGSALGVMLASPGLNPAAILLTFLLFPLDLSLTRLVAALAAVLLLPAILERLASSAVVSPAALGAQEEDGPKDWRDFLVRFGKSLVYMTAITVPLIAAGVLLSSLLLPMCLSMSGAGAILALLAVATFAVLVALPTFFEIPLAMLFLQMGLPGAAAAMLFAGPIVNLPSLFVLAKETNVRVAGGLAAGIWLLAVAAGIAVSV
jgi:hypothetical protein